MKNINIDLPHFSNDNGFQNFTIYEDAQDIAQKLIVFWVSRLWEGECLDTKYSKNLQIEHKRILDLFGPTDKSWSLAGIVESNLINDIKVVLSLLLILKILLGLVFLQILLVNI